MGGVPVAEWESIVGQTPPQELLVGAITGHKRPGVDGPAHLDDKRRVETSDWRFQPGSPENLKGVRAVGEVLPLKDALARSWPGHVFLVSYVVYGPDGAPLGFQPRVNKTPDPSGVSGADWLESLGYALKFHVLIADIDNYKPNKKDGKRPWDAELHALWNERIRKSQTMKTAGFYLSKHGMKIYQPLLRPLDRWEAEEALQAWWARLSADGIEVDKACKDWTRLYCAPDVVREGARYTGAVYPHKAQIEPPTPPPLADGTPAPTRTKATRTSKIKVDMPGWFASHAPESWREAIEDIGAAVAEEGPTQYHDLSLWIAGALLSGERGRSSTPRSYRLSSRTS